MIVQQVLYRLGATIVLHTAQYNLFIQARDEEHILGSPGETFTSVFAHPVISSSRTSASKHTQCKFCQMRTTTRMENSPTFPTFERAELEFLLEVLSQPEVNISNVFHTDLPEPMPIKRPQKQNRVICLIPTCHKASRVRGMCRVHAGGRTCSVEGCKKRDQKRGLCAKHGGVDQCSVSGCENVARVAKRCGKHKEAPSE